MSKDPPPLLGKVNPTSCHHAPPQCSTSLCQKAFCYSDWFRETSCASTVLLQGFVRFGGQQSGSSWRGLRLGNNAGLALYPVPWSPNKLLAARLLRNPRQDRSRSGKQVFNTLKHAETCCNLQIPLQSDSTFQLWTGTEQKLLQHSSFRLMLLQHRQCPFHYTVAFVYSKAPPPGATKLIQKRPNFHWKRRVQVQEESLRRRES